MIDSSTGVRAVRTSRWVLEARKSVIGECMMAYADLSSCRLGTRPFQNSLRSTVGYIFRPLRFACMDESGYVTTVERTAYLIL